MSDLLDRAEQYRQRAEEFAGRGGDHKNSSKPLRKCRAVSATSRSEIKIGRSV